MIDRETFYAGQRAAAVVGRRSRQFTTARTSVGQGQTNNVALAVGSDGRAYQRVGGVAERNGEVTGGTLRRIGGAYRADASSDRLVMKVEPVLRGKAAVKAAKRARRLERERKVAA